MEKGTPNLGIANDGRIYAHRLGRETLIMIGSQLKAYEKEMFKKLFVGT